MAEQKAAARAAWKGSGEKASDEIWFDLAEELGATEFTGYGATVRARTALQRAYADPPRAEEALDDAARGGPGSIALWGALAGADVAEPL